MLYTSPSPPSHNQNQFDQQTLNFAREIVNSESHNINTNELEEEEDEEQSEELGFHKLTRAQRKRLRKQKLKEAASERREIIGPQLPGNQWPEGVRRNAEERPESVKDGNNGTEVSSCSKVKHRRMSKNNARDKLTPPSTNDSHGENIFDFLKWAFLSRSGHKKRRLLSKLGSSNMDPENGAQFSRIRSFDPFCGHVPMWTLRINGETCTRLPVDVGPVKGLNLQRQKCSLKILSLLLKNLACKFVFQLQIQI
ncbi:uncharacterized protein LOC143600283 isoform X1 [Bidens hawaiensis]|uniref:uncharacterized protein LOC143600283 isoform X1 n=1 Tax=Bidens hawaiensis TaxID=980011 RepID=UPI00404A2FF1